MKELRTIGPALLMLLLATGPLHADDAEKKAVQAVEKLGGRGQPVARRVVTRVGRNCQKFSSTPIWQANLVEARKETQRRGLPLLVFVCEPASYWSARMERATFADPHVAHLLQQRLVVVKLLSTNVPELLNSHGIDVFPTTMFESPTGGMLGTKQVGYLDADKMFKVLTNIQELAKQQSTD